MTGEFREKKGDLFISWFCRSEHDLRAHAYRMKKYRLWRNPLDESLWQGAASPARGVGRRVTHVSPTQEGRGSTGPEYHLRPGSISDPHLFCSRSGSKSSTMPPIHQKYILSSACRLQRDMVSSNTHANLKRGSSGSSSWRTSQHSSLLRCPTMPSLPTAPGALPPDPLDGDRDGKAER
ncbi:hypothetical protein J2129_000276 [Methanofollis sp. W23]|nr:hypothetical protein [Methanofollis sp. W23]